VRVRACVVRVQLCVLQCVRVMFIVWLNVYYHCVCVCSCGFVRSRVCVICAFDGVCSLCACVSVRVMFVSFKVMRVFHRVCYQCVIRFMFVHGKFFIVLYSVCA